MASMQVDLVEQAEDLGLARLAAWIQVLLEAHVC